MKGHRGPGHRGNSTRAESDQDLLRRDQSSHRAAAAGGHSQHPDEAANMAAKLKAKGMTVRWVAILTLIHLKLLSCPTSTVLL